MPVRKRCRVVSRSSSERRNTWDGARKPVEQKAGPEVTGMLFGAVREPKDRQGVPQVLSWRPRLSTKRSSSQAIQKAASQVPWNLEVCRMKARRGSMSMDASSMSDEMLLGARISIKSTLKSSRARMQTRCRTRRSSERGG
jgi:hypothetical protein